MKKEEKKYWSTRDIYLATTLVTLGFYPEGVDIQIEGEKNKPVGYFKFELSDKLLETEKQYWQGLIGVEPKTFITNMRGLKAQVNDIYKNPHND